MKSRVLSNECSLSIALVPPFWRFARPKGLPRYHTAHISFPTTHPVAGTCVAKSQTFIPKGFASLPRSCHYTATIWPGRRALPSRVPDAEFDPGFDERLDRIEGPRAHRLIHPDEAGEIRRNGTTKYTKDQSMRLVFYSCVLCISWSKPWRAARTNANRFSRSPADFAS